MTVSATYEYTAACVPHSGNSERNYCSITLLSSTQASVEISTVNETISFTLPPGQVYEKDYDEDLHPTQGMENKAIRISSDVELQILVYKSELDSYHSDVYMVPNHIRQNNTYFTSSHPGLSYCGTSYTKQFYLVTSFYDNTSIQILQQDGTTYEFSLPIFGTFVQSSTDPDDHLALGTEISSNKPINVVSGNLCLRNQGGGSASFVGTYVSSMPCVASLGQQYIVPNIIHEDMNSAGYSLTVVATEDDTTVDSNGDFESLDQGETALFEYPLTDKSITVNCSRNCLVTQYSKFLNEDPFYFGLFMQNILPENDFTTSSLFNTLDVVPSSYVSLVVKGESPGDDLYLNGSSLGYLNWTSINGYSTAELAFPSGVYELDSVDSRPYAAYVYFHLNNGGSSAGYALLPTESSRITPSSTVSSTMPTSTTTPTPSMNGTLPQYTARVNGTARTQDGEDMSPACIMVSVKNTIHLNEFLTIHSNIHYKHFNLYLLLLPGTPK